MTKVTKEYLVKDSDSLDSLLKIDVTITNPEGEPPSNVWVEDLGKFAQYDRLNNCYLLDFPPELRRDSKSMNDTGDWLK